MKKIYHVFLFTVLFILFNSVFASFSAFAAEKLPVDIYLDGTKTEIEAYLIDGVAYVDMENFCKTVDNANVIWDHSKLVMDVCSDTTWIRVEYPWDYLASNGRYFYIDFTPQIISDKLFMPVRLMSKLYCQYVNWNEISSSVEIVSTGEVLENGDTYYNSDDLYWLSRIINAESRGEPLLGKIAVGNVVMNRVCSPAYPDTIYGVIFDKRFGVQFTPTVNNAIYKTPSDESILAAKICLEGYSVSNSAIYFLNKKTAQNNWIVNNRPFLKTIGNHSFYS